MAKSLKQKTLNQILYISIGSVIGILILFIILFNVFNRKGDNNKIASQDNPNSSVEQASSSIGKSVNEVEGETSVSNNNESVISSNVGDDISIDNSNNNKIDESLTVQTNNDLDASEPNDNEYVEIANVPDGSSAEDDNMAEEVVPDPIFVMPVDGEVVKQYGKEKLIYSNTLKEWTTHFGIDIKADKTTIVKSSSDGVVKSIKNDPRFGLTVVIEHQNEFNSIYSNLLTAEFVTVGEKVKTGQTIGTVGNSATFEILDEPHLHFEITKGGENVDPEMVVK